jgi:peptidoglycan/xylan/chitin deacetylase (PgdA/CDA1 family)
VVTICGVCGYSFGVKRTRLAQLLLLFLALASPCLAQSGSVETTETNPRFVFDEGAIIRGNKTVQKLALVFTGDEFADGAETIIRVLKRQGVKASFFFTGRFYRNPDFKLFIQKLKRDGHYLGAHSDEHLLYSDWNKRDELLISREKFEADLNKNYVAMQAFGISKKNARFFLPPFEWYNRSITDWTAQMGLQLINFTPGTRSNADYTTPGMKNYVSSEAIMHRIKEFEARDPAGLNGFILLLHIGVAPERTDKFYDRLDDLIKWLVKNKYQLVRIDQLLKHDPRNHTK